jgi:hypothetical protein
MHGCDCLWRVEGVDESFPSYAGARKFASTKSVFTNVKRDTSGCACKCYNCDETNPALKVKLR